MGVTNGHIGAGQAPVIFIVQNRAGQACACKTTARPARHGATWITHSNATAWPRWSGTAPAGWSLDEELELELDDRRLDGEDTSDEDWRANRQRYFRELPPAGRAGQAAGLWCTPAIAWSCCSRARCRRQGGVIKRITQRLNPRVCRVAALPAPTSRERTQWYFQRYAAHLPAAGEIVLFDRSWYNRAGVERVMGFVMMPSTRSSSPAPEFEKMLARSGIQIIKYWFSVSDNEQEARFESRINDPLKQWKLSPMDLESRRRWEAYTQAKEVMLERTHIPESPWWIVRADDKKRPA